MGKFIVIDGLDGSGKGTQTDILVNHLKKEGKKVRTLSFPMYDNDSSFFVKMYLEGKLGKNPSDTNSYASSMFFACDRYISFRTDWINDYNDKETIIVANRYSSANAVHQLSKLPKEEWDGFLSWLWDFEFTKLGLPKPDLTIYLELTPDLSLSLVDSRSKKTGQKKDIHELDTSYMNNCYEAALYSSLKLGWNKIKCYKEGKIRTIDDISEEIYEIVSKLL